MGYYATASGEVTLKPDVDPDVVMDLLDYLYGELFQNDNCIEFYTSDKYHEDDVIKTLDSLLPYITEGEVCYDGEDDTHWRFILRDGNWIEQNGHIVYDDA